MILDAPPSLVGQLVQTPSGIGLVVNSSPHGLWHQVARLRLTPASRPHPVSFVAPIPGTDRAVCLDTLTVNADQVTLIASRTEAETAFDPRRAELDFALRAWRESFRDQETVDYAARVERLVAAIDAFDVVEAAS